MQINFDILHFIELNSPMQTYLCSSAINSHTVISVTRICFGISIYNVISSDELKTVMYLQCEKINVSFELLVVYTREVRTKLCHQYYISIRSMVS